MAVPEQHEPTSCE